MNRVRPWLPALLGYISAVGPLATDMYLPGLPTIEAEFHAIPGSSQITLAAWLLGLAIGQVLQGTLSDRFGRRAPLLVAMGLYLVATAGCALAPNLAVLATWRIFAAIGGSAGMVIPRAIVRDYVTGNAAARMMSQQMLVMGVAPILAPTLGGLLIGITGWRGIFWFQFGFGVLAMVLIWAFLPESLPLDRRVRTDLVGLLTRWTGIVTERGFLTHTVIAGATAIAVFSYLGGAPVLFRIYGLTPVLVGVMFGVNGLSFIIATQVNGALAHRVGGVRLMGFGVVAFAVGAALVTIACFSGLFGFVGLSVALVMMLASTGFMMPNAPVGALLRHAQHAGSASALMGTLQYTMGAASGVVVTAIADSTGRPLGIMAALAGVIALVAAWLRPTRR
jgi:MFS transporter, DHA1 family, multidrug resistance protein